VASPETFEYTLMSRTMYILLIPTYFIQVLRVSTYLGP